ncbi:TIGR01244 family sulfur transferase [Sphingosinicella sp. BN140058]|uniref:TIGR01244 family sulfur transferase n=1 Tax=Sphingosinicella sp. BN140058 TaxID=1892855 RepID=UPI00101236D0|nr:TIGR01244 family sulfur transferase [Sphingosinicella sp. BN140058]QAY76811.1 TIGR01244 family phosphatase [Sphingosinicella sp. BN140058]
MIRQIDESMMVSGQLYPERLGDLGVAMVINNRPDREEPGQPSSAEIEAAAAAAGIAYHHIPIAGGFSDAQVQEMQDALSAAEGPTLAFCKSGTRSIYLWALARARMGDDADALLAKGAAAGYDLTPIRGYLA